jgi:hypothetical protein
MAYAGGNTDWLAANRVRESGGNPTAKNPYSSAYGADQFINSTWLNLARKYRPDLAKLPQAELLALRADPKLSEEFVGYNNKESTDYLASKGKDVNNTNLGLAHRFGPAGAVSVLSAAPNTPIANLFPPKVMEQNPDLRGRTVGDVIAEYDNSFQRSTPKADKTPMQNAMNPNFQDAKNALGISGPAMGAMGSPMGIQPPTWESTVGQSTSTPTQADASKGYDWGKAILGVGAGLSSIDNPQGAAIALGMLRDRQHPEGALTSYQKLRLAQYADAQRAKDKAAADKPGTFEKESEKAAVKRYSEIELENEAANLQMGQLAEMRKHLNAEGLYTGPAGEQVTWLKSLGTILDPDNKELMNATDAAQALQALTNQGALGLRSPKGIFGGLTGNTSDRDIQFLKDGLAGLGKTPGANKLIIEALEKIYQRKLEYNAEAARWIEENGKIAGLITHMTEWGKAKGNILAPNDDEEKKPNATISPGVIKTPGGLTLEPL